MLQAVADELASAAGEPLLLLRNIRLTTGQAGQLASTLSELAGGLEDAGDGAARYGLLIGLYQPRQPGPAGPDAQRPESARHSRVVVERDRDNGSR